MRVTNNMITSNTKSNINANKVLVDKYNTQMTTQKKINNRRMIRSLRFAPCVCRPVCPILTSI